MNTFFPSHIGVVMKILQNARYISSLFETTFSFPGIQREVFAHKNKKLCVLTARQTTHKTKKEKNKRENRHIYLVGDVGLVGEVGLDGDPGDE